MMDIDKLISKMTLEEKAGLCSGLDFWHTKPVSRLGVDPIMVSDGPNGLRLQKADSDHLGLGQAATAVCFPTGSALGSSFDTGIAGVLGRTIAEAAKNEGLHTVLGPAINMKRSPLCGRNFEYISEDPCLAGELASSYVSELQQGGIGACVKHFAANNQEYCRMSTDTVVSERALREIYLKAFETVVRKARPWSIMCAYNRLNGTYCCENEWFLDQVLRKEWGFDGIVMTDWGAMNDRIKALRAGLELEMPSSNGIRDRLIVKAVKEGKLDESVLDEAVRRLLKWIFRSVGSTGKGKLLLDEQHEVARKMAEESAVLLKNDTAILPLDGKRSIAFIGTFAKSPRYQGGGSSHVTSYKVTNALDSVRGFASVSYFDGWADDGCERDDERLEDAIHGASDADIAVIFAGLPDAYESEGIDRRHIDLPCCQNELIEKVAALQENVVVVLHNGSPVTMPWLDKVRAVLEMNLAGEAVGEATVDILFGDVNPSGHLAETYPIRIEDSPSFLSFPGSGKKVVYREDVFIGYRWYDSLDMPVLFPFGYGLSYTSFEITKASLDCRRLEAEIRNTGKFPGKQVIQLYIRPPRSREDRPVHELKAFRKVMLMPGETKTVSFEIDNGMLSYYNEEEKCWTFDSGCYQVELGFSSRDIRQVLQLNAENDRQLELTEASTVGDMLESGLADKMPSFITEVGRCFGIGSDVHGDAMDSEASLMLYHSIPVHSIASFIEVPDDYVEEVEEVLRK